MPFSEEYRRQAAPDTPQDYSAIVTWQQDPSPQNTQAMLKTLQPVINSAIAGHIGQGEVSNPLMRSRAKIMAINAMKRFNPKEAKLTTYLFGQLTGLRRVARQQQQILSIPERQSLERAHLKRLEAQLADEFGRQPAEAELADRSGLSVLKIRRLQSLGTPSAEGGVSQRTSEDGDAGLSPASTIPGAVDSQSWLSMVRSDLDPVDQDIFDHTLGFNQRPIKTTQDLAMQFKMSPAAISQRKAKIQSKVDMEQQLSPFYVPPVN